MPTRTEAQQKAAKGCLGCAGLVVLAVVGLMLLGTLTEDSGESKLQVGQVYTSYGPANDTFGMSGTPLKNTDKMKVLSIQGGGRVRLQLIINDDRNGRTGVVPAKVFERPPGW